MAKEITENVVLNRKRNDDLLASTEDESKLPIDALVIFAGELWELIIGQLTNSHDVLNVLRAFPDLDKLFSNKKFAWMLDLILPHIMTKYLLIKQEHGQEDYEYLVPEELFKLRVMSKRWKNAVDSSLQNHSDRHPPLPLDKNTTENKSLALIPENHFNYHRMQKFHMGATIFHQAKHVDQFLCEMANHKGNPFPGRFVFINRVMFDPKATDDLFVRKAVQLMEKFGQHISILDWELADDDVESNLEMCKIILKGLSYVPNLKSLTIRGDYDSALWESVNDFFENPETHEMFPELPFLECFDWRIRPVFEDNSWINNMMNKYGKQMGIWKLAMDVHHFSADFVSSTLTELHLLLEHIDNQKVDAIKENLILIPNGQIRKLCLSDTPCRNYGKDFCINKFVKMLAGFQIETIVLDRFYFIEDDDNYDDDNYDDDNIKALSVTSLYMEDVDLDNKGNVYANKLRKYFFQADAEYVPNSKEICDDFSIWDALPNLEIECFSG